MALSTQHQVGLFIKHFNCACNKIIMSNKFVSAEALNWGLRANQFINRDALGYWRVRGGLDVHPLAIMLVGQRAVKKNPLVQLEYQYKISTDCIASTFLQGFLNMPHYRDCWGGYDNGPPHPTFYYSLFFNLGRAFLDKYLRVKLPYELPAPYNQMFEELK